MQLRHICIRAALALLVGSASAHDARPLSVEITTRGTELFHVRVRVPPTVEPDNQPRVEWPANCGEVRESLVRCIGGLRGRDVGVSYPLYNPSLSTLFRLREQDGTLLTEVLTPDQERWRVPAAPGWRQVAGSYLTLGMKHIWLGIDHLLFVAGVLFLAATWRRVLLAITGFTLAHSLTLSLSALGLVQLPVTPVEAAIALSILFLAREVARPFPGGLASRFPILVSTSFGFLHGFGFAAALREVGLPDGELIIGLLFFNLGVEIGQIVFIAALVVLLLVLRRIAKIVGPLTLLPQVRFNLAVGYALGIPAAFWFIQRVATY